MKVQIIAGALSRMSIQNFNHLQVYFCGRRPSLISFFFLGEGRDTMFVTPVRVHRKYNISMYFLRKVISHFLPKGKISCFQGKNTIFPDNTRKIMYRRGPFWKDHLSEKLKKISYFRVFFKKLIFFRLTCKIIFSGKRNITFLDNTRKIIFQHNFFGKTIFSGRLEKGKYGFPCSVRSIKIIIRSRVLYYLFLYLCTRTFFRSVENFPWRGNFICCSVFRISVSHRVLAQVLIAPVLYVASCISYPLGLSDVNSMSAAESSYFK